MTTELVWTGTETSEVFVDAETNDEYWPRDADTDRPHTVPDSRVEWLLDHDGWAVPKDATRDEIFRALPAEAEDDEEDTPTATTSTEGDQPSEAGMITVGHESGDDEPSRVEGSQSDEEQRESDGGQNLTADGKTISEAAVASEDAGDSFDPDDFVNETDWRAVKSAISEGEVDDHLDAIEDAERGRDSPREKSVLSAIEGRRKSISADVGEVEDEAEPDPDNEA